jgi:hypothetical protein
VTSPLPGEHEFDSPGIEKLRESAVDAIAWALIDNSMDTADRQPSEEAYRAAVEQARALLPTLAPSPLPTDEDLARLRKHAEAVLAAREQRGIPHGSVSVNIDTLLGLLHGFCRSVVPSTPSDEVRALIARPVHARTVHPATSTPRRTHTGTRGEFARHASALGQPSATPD